MPIIMALLVVLMLILFSKLTWLLIPIAVFAVLAVVASKVRGCK